LPQKGYVAYPDVNMMTGSPTPGGGRAANLKRDRDRKDLTQQTLGILA
jgi:hypothetical protein